MELPSRRWSLLIAGATQVACAVFIGGRLHPDEVHQYLEPAHRMVWGVGARSHEWHSGMRNLVGPGAIAALFGACRALGLNDPRVYLTVLKVVLGGVSLLVMARWAESVRRVTASEHSARLAALVLALWVPWQNLAFRSLGENFSTHAVMLALAYFTARRRGFFAAGAMAGMAFVLRYPAGLFLPVFLVVLARGRDRVALAQWAAGLVLTLAGLGLVDAVVWGEPFHSVIAYVDYNIVRGQARAYGERPLLYYLACAATLAPAGLLALAYHGRASLRRAEVPLALAAVYLAGMSLLAHKEARFFLPAVPLLITAAVQAREEWSPRRTALAVALTAVHSAVIFGALRVTDYTQREAIAAVVELGREPELTALWVMNRPHPGFVQVNRAVPLRADPGGRLDPMLVRLDMALHFQAQELGTMAGTTFAVCDAGGDGGDRCVSALESRGFRRRWARGSVTALTHPGTLGTFNVRPR